MVMKVEYLSVTDYHKNNDDLVLVIGTFDGFHLGHEKLIEQGLKLSKVNKFKLAIMSLDVLYKNKQDKVLQSLSQKEKYLERYGVDVLYIVEFDDQLKKMSAQDFIDKFLKENEVRYVVCGPDFRYGHKAKGDIQLLMDNGIRTKVVDFVLDDKKKKVSSSKIHKLIKSGQIVRANQLLGYPYELDGQVMRGKQLGRKIGFPTANLSLNANYELPKAGVYMCKVIYDGQEYYGLTNIGHNPTFNYVNELSIETYIYNFDKMIYDEQLSVQFLERMRDEKKFKRVEDLIKQLETDKKKLEEYLNS